MTCSNMFGSSSQFAAVLGFRSADVRFLVSPQVDCKGLLHFRFIWFSTIGATRFLLSFNPKL